MKKQIICFALCAMLFALSFPAEAQKAGKMARIGYLSHHAGPHDSDEAFLQALRDLGWVEGKNIAIEYRWTARKRNRYPVMAEELVHLKVDVIVGRGTRAVQAAKNASRTIPIIMAMVADPMRSGIVASLAWPGGNITGLTTIMPELTGKQLELLKEVVPKLSRVAFLAYPRSGTDLFVKEAQDAGQILGVQIQVLVVKGPEEFESALLTMTRERASALVVLPFFIGGLGHGRQIADLAARSGLPTVSSQMKFVYQGGLISYGPDVLIITRRAAYFVDKILKGAKPADLPVEQPRKFELVINLKTAKQLGLTTPPEVLYRADKVIK